MGSRGKRAFVAGVAASAVAFALVVIPVAGSAAAPSVPDCSPAGGSSLRVLKKAVTDWKGYTEAQMQYAATIVQVGAEEKVSARGQQIALMTALVESDLEPRPRAGAGESTEETTQEFYEALRDVPDWQSLNPPTLAAHAVRGNADPYAYSPSWDEAGDILARLTGTAGPRRSAPPATPVSSALGLGTGTIHGQMPTDVAATPSGPVDGDVVVANANIKLPAGIRPGLAALAGPRPDFITLNEVGDVPEAVFTSAAPGYGFYRDPVADPSPDGGQRSLDNALMWRADTWSLLDGGRVKIVTQNQVIFGGGNRSWGQWATWGVFRRTDGAVVSVVSTHHMTNPFRFPHQQWGSQPFTRAQQYGDGMDRLIELTRILEGYGPVLVGGDMNSHPDEGPLAAAPKMATAGYDYTKDSGVMYNFYAAPMTVTRTWEISKQAVHSDHPALFTEMAFNGAAGDPVVDQCAVALRTASGRGFLRNAAAASVGPYNRAGLLPRVSEYAADGGGWGQRSQNFAAALVDRPMSGYESAASTMARFRSKGVFHSASSIDGQAPPVGAWLYYSHADHPYGYVVTYLGDGEVAGPDTWRTDRVDRGPASALTRGRSKLTYEGWAVPWATPATDVPVRAPLVR